MIEGLPNQNLDNVQAYNSGCATFSSPCSARHYIGAAAYPSQIGPYQSPGPPAAVDLGHTAPLLPAQMELAARSQTRSPPATPAPERAPACHWGSPRYGHLCSIQAGTHVGGSARQLE